MVSTGYDDVARNTHDRDAKYANISTKTAASFPTTPLNVDILF